MGTVFRTPAGRTAGTQVLCEILGKRFFLRLAADVIREVNMVRDKDGVSFVRKAVLQCGLGVKMEFGKFHN